MISDVAFFSECGGRMVNQDAICVSAGKTRGVFAVADGMGGHASGEIASGAVVNGLRSWWESSHLVDLQAGIEQVEEQCYSLLMNINAAVFMDFVAKGQMGGSTVAVLILWDDSYLTLSAGDSRIYVAKKRTLEQLTVDDVWENLPSVKYEMSNEKMMNDTRFGKLTEALGSEERLKISRASGILSGREVFLLCSDGVHKYCAHEELEKILCKRGRFRSADRMKKLILKCALKGGVDDNYSAVICKVGKKRM